MSFHISERQYEDMARERFLERICAITHAAFKRRGVAAPCEAKLQKFR